MVGNKNFMRLILGQAVSQIGDKLHLIALASWVLVTTGSPGKMGLVLAASLVPSLLLGLVSGAYIDRYPLKYFIVGPDLIRGVILVGFGLFVIFGAPGFGLVLLVQALLSVNGAFFDPAVPTAIPRMVARDELARANSLHQAVAGMAMVVGACLGGILSARLGYGMLFLLNGISFLVSAGLEMGIELPRNPGAVGGEPSQWECIRRGYAHVLGHAALPGLLAMVMVIHFAVGGLEVFLPVIAHDLARDGAWALGLAQAAFGLGTLVMGGIAGSGSLLAGREVWGLFGGVTAMGVIYGCGSLFLDGGRLPLFLVLVFFFGACIMVAAASFRTLIQRETEEGYGGRVFALVSSVSNGSLPLAMAAYGMVLEQVSFKLILGISGLALVGLGVGSLVKFKGVLNDEKSRSTQT
ncbi:MAG: MFS transporter [Desulfobacterales bacterium]|nr:MFS transporter [Desulfobacterales bacterium]